MSFSLSSLSQPVSPAATSILGVRIDRISQQQVLDALDQLVAQAHEQRARGEQVVCQQIVTVNLEYLMAAQRNAGFRRCLSQARLAVADGAGVVWAARYLGTPVPERITGTDTLPELAKRCAARGYRLYLLGAAPGVAEDAAQHLQKLAPGVQIAGTYSGSLALVEEDAIIARIAQAQADVLCVAYGAPAQDLWIQRNLERLPVALAMGVGGAFDFLTGRQLRAPKQMQRMGLEWLYRLYREPWRWRRMLALPQAALLIIVKGHKA